MSPREDAFYLAYMGLHWSVNDILDMTPDMRRWFVARMERQQEAEKQQAEE